VSVRLSVGLKGVAECVSTTVSWFAKYQTLLIIVCEQRSEKNIRHSKFQKDKLQHTGATLYDRLYGLHGLSFANIEPKTSHKKHGKTHFGLITKYQLFICPGFLQFVSWLDYSGRKVCLEKAHSK